MSDHITDEMLNAVWETVDALTGEALSHAQAREVADAVLAAAPTVDGWVWCELHDLIARTDFPASCHEECSVHCPPCPGPHKALLLGPESPLTGGDR